MNVQHVVMTVFRGINTFTKTTPIDIQTNIYLFKINNRKTIKKCEICSKLTLNIFTVNFEHISHFFMVFLLLTLKN